MRPMIGCLVVLVVGCDQPDSTPPSEAPELRGDLVIDGDLWRLYQDGDRLEQVPDLERLPEGMEPE